MNERALFLEALDKEPAKRTEFLDESCGADQPLRTRVELLLKSHADSGVFLETPALEQNTLADDTPADMDLTMASHVVPNPDMALDFLAPPKRSGSLGRLAHYEVMGIVGRGGMGQVLRAFDEKLQRVVALKLVSKELASSPAARKRFIREAISAAQISHENVVSIYGVEDEGPVPYLVMNLIVGKSLEDRLKEEGSLELTEVLRIGMQIASGLAAAHRQGLIHRDIKPANILLENGIQKVKITDFGLARLVDDATMTQTGAIAGTPQYMSPEQAQDLPIDHRSDLFSLGSVLYAMCTGRPPFRASTAVAVLRRVCDDTPRPIQELNPDIPTWLCEIINRLLAKRPADRFQSAKEVADLLAEHLCEAQRVKVTESKEPRVDLAARPEPRGGKDGLPGFLSEPRQTGNAATTVAVAPLKHKPRWPMQLAWFLLAAAVVAGIILINTKSGQFVIETDDPDFSFRVTQEGAVLLADRKTNREYVLKVTNHDPLTGSYDLQITDELAGLGFTARTLTIKRGERVALKAWFEPNLAKTGSERNPFGVPDVPDPEGEDVKSFASQVALQGGDADANAPLWTELVGEAESGSIDGEWASRWRGGDASDWVSGTARIKSLGDRVYIFMQDGSYLIAARREGTDRLVGRYMNLNGPSDSTPWVGRIVGPDRIDGQWNSGKASPVARWDFRRKVQSPQVVPYLGSLLDARGQNGKIIYYDITGSNSGSVFGTDIYTDDSALNVAAVHAGILRAGERGVVKVTILPGQKSYRSSIRNGVSTYGWGAWASSFMVEKTQLTPAESLNQQFAPVTNSFGPSAIEGKVGDVRLVSIMGGDLGYVWGTDVYTSDSDLATAAVHAGVLKPGERGIVKVTILEGRAAYSGSLRNGIRSSEFGAWDGSYRVEAAHTMPVDMATWGTLVDPRQLGAPVREAARITFNIPGDRPYDLIPLEGYNLDAPRLLQQVRGDFVLQASIPAFPRPQAGQTSREGGKFAYRGAGLVVIANEQSLLRFERGALGEVDNGAPFLHAMWFVPGKPPVDERFPLPGDPEAVAHLRIERFGDLLRLRYSPDGNNWNNVRTADGLAFPPQMSVGLIAASSTRDSFSPKLENVQLLHVTADAARGNAGPSIQGAWNDQFGGVVNLQHDAINGAAPVAVRGQWLDYRSFGNFTEGRYEPSSRSLTVKFDDTVARQSGVATFIVSEDFQTMRGSYVYDNGFTNVWLLSRRTAGQARLSIAGAYDSEFGVVTLKHDPIRGTKPVEVTGDWDGRPLTFGKLARGLFDPTEGTLVIECHDEAIDVRGSAKLWLVDEGRTLRGTYLNETGQSGIWTMRARDKVAVQAPAWQPLFNGTDLTGWVPAGSWSVKDGILASESGGQPGVLRTKRTDFRDFHLRAEVRINDGGNSGIFFRFPGQWKANVYEAQINSSDDDPIRTGSLWNLGVDSAVTESPVAPGEWCTLEVIAKGNEITLRVNGKVTTHWIDPAQAYLSGAIGLQQYTTNTVVEFRKIEIQEYKDDNAQAATPTWRQDIARYLWPNGSNITVGFVDATRHPEMESKVKLGAEEWGRYANLNFQFLGNDHNAMLRISFDPQLLPKGFEGANELAGRGTLALDRAQFPHWNGFVRPNPDQPDRVMGSVLHMFGHLLGLIHEDQRVGYPWDEEKVYRYYASASKWTRETTYERILRPRLLPENSPFDQFDADSVMTLPLGIRAELLRDGTVLKPNNQLSQRDKRLISDLYPGRWTPATEEAANAKSSDD